MKNNSYLINIIALVIFAVILLIIHFLVYGTLPTEYKTENFYIMHLFLFFLTLVIYLLRLKIVKSESVFSGYYFLGTNLGKIIACCIFLLPVIIDQNEKNYAYVIQFLVIYFSYLFFEMFMMIRKLRNKY